MRFFIIGLVTVMSVCNAQVASSDEGLLLHWKLDGNLTDSSGNAQDGVASVPMNFVPGREGQSIVFDGSGAVVQAPTNLPEMQYTFTVECWVKPAAPQVPYADIYGNHENNFVGFALQQDGVQTNRYYFTYGTGSYWFYSRTFSLVADVWQHLTITKTPDELLVFVNGLLIDRRSAPEPMKTSNTNFLLGLGIAGQQRWYAGQVSDLKIWSVAHKPTVTVPLNIQLDTFIATAEITCEASSRWRLFRSGEHNTLTFGIDPESVPASVEEISIVFNLSDDKKNPVKFAEPLVLTRENNFEASVAIPEQPGLWRLAYQPTVKIVNSEQKIRGGQLDYLVLRQQDDELNMATSINGNIAGNEIMSAGISLDGTWKLATDPKNEGETTGWFNSVTADAKDAKVPWIIQDAFPEYHGVAWYWREFEAPINPHVGGRYLLKFGAVDYYAKVWVNGKFVGEHEGGETPFALDVTEALKPGGVNFVTVRVLNPSHEPIDNMTLNTAPRRAKVIPYSPGASYNHGGIVEPVELAIVPAVYVTDLYLRPDMSTGDVYMEATVFNSGAEEAALAMRFDISPANEGRILDEAILAQNVAPGASVIRCKLNVGKPHLWDLHDPFLYRVNAVVSNGASVDSKTDRCGFREFVFANGYFRLNGRRIILRSAHTVNAMPVGQQIEEDFRYFQRDVLYMKTMGFNCIRFIWGGATKRQLDMCDEMGLMVYNEHAASNPMQMTDEMARRFDISVSETILRDRNHASVVIWGLLNETPEGPVFRHAVGMLPLVRSLDETRMVALNSGRWDGQLDIGSYANPGTSGWEVYMGAEGPGAGQTSWGPSGGYVTNVGDAHVYPRVPHTSGVIDFIRDLGKDIGPIFMSEYGIGSAIDLWRITRQFERIGKPEAEDAQYYRQQLTHFLSNWDSWKLNECFADPQDFFAQSLKKMAGQRTLGLNAIRSNPKIIAYNLTGMMDHVNCGEGLFTLFRELKPGTTDAMFDGFAPLRFCLFAEPNNIWNGGKVKIEVILANEDALVPGDYPVHVQIIGPGMKRIYEQTVSVMIPATVDGYEAPLAIPVLTDEIPVEGPTGEYRLMATMETGGAPAGEAVTFNLFNKSQLPVIPANIVLCGEDVQLADWLVEKGARVDQFGGDIAPDSVILVAGKPQIAGDEQQGWDMLVNAIEAGATAIFLRPEVFANGDDLTAWLPLEQKGIFRGIHSWLYLKDEWNKEHPIFAGLQCGGLMDYVVYHNIIPDTAFVGQPAPDEAICGAIKASQGYDSGMMVLSYNKGNGRMLLNCLRVREELGQDPVADVLLCNMLCWAAGM